VCLPVAQAKQPMQHMINRAFAPTVRSFQTISGGGWFVKTIGKTNRQNQLLRFAAKIR
jgi:hypothetical protein